VQAVQVKSKHVDQRYTAHYDNIRIKGIIRVISGVEHRGTSSNSHFMSVNCIVNVVTQQDSNAQQLFWVCLKMGFLWPLQYRENNTNQPMI
jgi:hypothetical protein